MSRPKVPGAGRLNITIVRYGPLSFRTLWDTPSPHTHTHTHTRWISRKYLQRAPHLSCGGVPGSPRASPPEFQALPGSPNGEGPCSSGACSSPPSHRHKGQGNMPRLGGGKRRATLMCPVLTRPPTPGLHSVSASLSVWHYAAGLGEPRMPAHLTHLAGPRSNAGAQCVSSAFPGHVACAPAGVPRATPVGRVSPAWPAFSTM